MIHLRRIHILLVMLFGAIPLPSQEPVKGSQVFGDLSPERMNLISESRRQAFKELTVRSAGFHSPDIATTLESGYPIAIARITAVEPPSAAPRLLEFGYPIAIDPPRGGSPRTRVSFHVQQMLRGGSSVDSFDAESRWAPRSPSNEDEPVLENFSTRGTVLDYSEPKVGDLYIIGYTFPYGNQKTAFVSGAIDLQDPAQARLIGEMEQFLSIERTAGDSGFAPYLAALDGSIPWFRDIAVHRLTSSDSCISSIVCAERFAETVQRQLHSRTANERLEAVFWISWVGSVSRSQSEQKGWPDGMPILPDSVIRQLLAAAKMDTNVYVGDQAYSQLEEFEFRRAGRPGDCIQIIPELRKSVPTLDFNHSLLPPEIHATYSISCIPAQQLPSHSQPSATVPERPS